MFSACCEGMRSLQSAAAITCRSCFASLWGGGTRCAFCPCQAGPLKVHQCFAEHDLSVQMIASLCMHAAFTTQQETVQQLLEQGWPSSSQNTSQSRGDQVSCQTHLGWAALTPDRQPLDEQTLTGTHSSNSCLSSLLPTACLQPSAGALRQGSPHPHALAARTTTSPAQPPSTSTWTGQSLLRTTLHRWRTCMFWPPSHGLHLQLAAC